MFLKNSNKLFIDKNNFKKFLLIIFSILFLGVGILVYFTSQQLENDSLLRIRESSDELNLDIYNRLNSFLRIEEERDFYQYSANNGNQSLSEFRKSSKITSFSSLNNGVIGYFQVVDNKFESPIQFSNNPLKDKDHGTLGNYISGLKVDLASIPPEFREDILEDINQIKNSISGRTRTPSLDEKIIKKAKFNSKSLKKISKKLSKKSKKDIPVFERKRYDRGKFIPLYSKTNHILFIRKIYIENKRYIQGFLADSNSFFEQLIKKSFETKYLSDYASLVLRLKKDYIFQINEQNQDAKYFLNQSLDYFISDLNMEIIINEIPKSQSYNNFLILVAILVIIIFISFFGIYRIGITQIMLAEQRANFVSAVGHELKTPLTSISMYSEMLQDDIVADEVKKNSYYQFIFQESARLTRLINNILRLSKISKNKLDLNLEELSSSEIAQLIQKKTEGLLTTKEFKLTTSILDDEYILIDRDLISQIFINLIDNAVKFSKEAKQKELTLNIKKENNHLLISLRDYGKGIQKSEMEKVFNLFYRSENELTRTTTGTGIGLSLVKELVDLQNGSCELINQNPGLEVRIYFQISIERST